MTPREKKMAVLFFTELGEELAPRISSSEVFGFAYGQSNYDSPESLKSQLDWLLAGR